MEPGLTLPPAPRRDSGNNCVDPDCDATLFYGNEVVRIQVVLVQRGDGEMHQYPVIDEDDPARDFLFEPYYFCMDCWSKTYEFAKTELKDQLPITDAYSVFDCSFCASGIREVKEYTGVAEIGEFELSRRAPDGLRGPLFVVTAKPMLLCISCLQLVNEGYIELWSNLSQNGECIDCCTARCWRAPCSCTCHSDEETSA